MIDLLPRTMVLRERRDVVLVRPVLALTVYFDRGPLWIENAASELFARFFSRLGASLRYFRTSVQRMWHPLGDGRPVIEGLRSNVGLRHLLRVQGVDRIDVPTVAFTYRETDARPLGRAGYVQWVLPIDTPSDELLALAIEIGQTHPLLCAVGGPSLMWNEELPRNAFAAIFGLTKRFLGLDVQFPDEASRFARDKIASVGWLTILGDTMMDAHGMTMSDLVQAADASSGLTVLPLRGCTLVRAGSVPELGDLNSLDHPTSLRAASLLLHPFLVDKPLSFPGPFRERRELNDDLREETKYWRERFFRPELWT